MCSIARVFQVLESSKSLSLLSPRVFHVPSSSKSSSLPEYNILKCLENTTCFRVLESSRVQKYNVLSRENVSEVGPTFIPIRHSKLGPQATDVCTSEFLNYIRQVRTETDNKKHENRWYSILEDSRTRGLLRGAHSGARLNRSRTRLIIESHDLPNSPTRYTLKIFPPTKHPTHSTHYKKISV